MGSRERCLGTDGQVQHDAAFGNVEVEVVPIFLGGLMHAVCSIVPCMPARRVDITDGFLLFCLLASAVRQHSAYPH